ncbi:MAG: Gfo/Idh/MocA family oxidoreductase [Sedimentisphaerales bacterium]|nr:Gfo/Idh/MocA family oxidoreductase [Sedimentisphaerales bacterium]
MRTVRFGLIGCGLMGREFASAGARWCHLPEMDVRPEIVAICDKNEKMLCWFRNNFSTIGQVTDDYRELLANSEVEAVYIAIPHHLHEEFYCAAIRAGKHLMGEKPFGIDKAANEVINATIKKHPEVFVRCSSEFPFIPGLQRIGDMIEQKRFGTILEVNSGFLHCSDLDPNKPINWKRLVEYNGAYGCMGDLGMHPCHMPFRAGWYPKNVRAILSNVITERPDGKGNMVPCETWDNATLFCEAQDRDTQKSFPLTIKTQRIAPGEKDTWYFEVLGTQASVRFSTKNSNHLEVMEYSGGEQVWQKIDMGHETAFKSITGGIFEFGFSDAILQMWAAFLYELAHGALPKKFAGCITPEEVAYSHRLFAAALESHYNASTVAI